MPGVKVDVWPSCSWLEAEEAILIHSCCKGAYQCQSPALAVQPDLYLQCLTMLAKGGKLEQAVGMGGFGLWGWGSGIRV